MKIEGICGYETVSDIVTPDGWVKLMSMWSLVVEPILSQDGEFIRRFTLVMVNDLQNPSGAGVEIRCVSHATYGISGHLPSGPQICELAIRFRNMVKDAGWERSFWELYDFEDTRSLCVLMRYLSIVWRLRISCWR